MELLRKLRFVLYIGVIVLVFIFAAYCSFPNDVLREIATRSLTNVALGIGPKNRGLPDISMGKVSLWRLSGMSIKNVNMVWPPRKNEAPLTLNFDSVRGRVGIFSLMTGSKRFSGDIRLYGGDFQFLIGLTKNSSLDNLKLESSRIDFGKMAIIEQALGAPMQGVLQLMTNLHARTDMSKDGTGTIKMGMDNIVYGPGVIKLPISGMVSQLSVPQIKLGKLNAEFSVDKGQLETKTFTLSGGDVEADIKLSLGVNKNPTLSRLSGEGWFSVKRELVNTSETLKMLYDLVPALHAAYQGDGKVGIYIQGSLARPEINFEQYAGHK